MITLLLISIALAAAAPLFSKSSKNSAYDSMKWARIEQEQQNMKAEIEKLQKELKEKENDSIPQGAVMFFNSNAAGADNPCPAGWSQVPVNYNNRFIRITDGRQDSRGIGSFQDDAFQEHFHIVPWGDKIAAYSDDNNKKNYPWGYYWPDGITNVSQINYAGARGGYDYDNARAYTSPPALKIRRGSSIAYTARFLTGNDYTETRPKNIALLACVKN